MTDSPKLTDLVPACARVDAPVLSGGSHFGAAFGEC